MEHEIHPLAPHHLPSYIPGPDGSDPLFTVVVVFVVVLVAIVGNLYLRLHSMPERMAHRANSVQLQAVAALTLLALFTHNHTLWLAALLIALIRFPDLATPLYRIADVVERRFGSQASPPSPPGPAADAPRQEPRDA
ncbi:MAG: hypothetical protein AcusKO_25190 [Acuticoccus sp.]